MVAEKAEGMQIARTAKKDGFKYRIIPTPLWLDFCRDLKFIDAIKTLD